MDTCATCRFYSKEPIKQIVGGQPATEHFCLASKNCGFGAYGQDGGAILVYPNFGCVNHKKPLTANEKPAILST